MVESTHYGVHWAPGRIAFLHQERGGGGRNAIGLGQPSPFSISAKLPECPHQIPLEAPAPREHLATFRELLATHSTMRFLLPIPPHHEPTVAWSTAEVQPALADMLRMTSPPKPPIEWWWAARGHAARLAWACTNIAPLVVAGITLNDYDMVCAYARASLYLPRRVLLLVPDDFPRPPFHREVAPLPVLDLAALPWEAFGATVLRAYMRRNWDDQTYWFLDEGEVLDA